METLREPAATHVVAAFPGLSPRLLGDAAGVESLDRYRDTGGYQPVLDAAALLQSAGEAGLRGRGGAAFPFAVKARGVLASAARGRVPVVLANGEEGEPASVKDRWLLRNRPHLVLDGLRLAAAMVGADRCHVYVSDPAAAGAMARAVEDAALPVPVVLTTVDPAYVAGEESAAVRAVNGGPAKPTEKPPRPFESGVDGLPTLVSNVETLANLPFLQRHGAAAYRAVGTAASPGTFLATVSGGGRPPALYELPHGLPLRELLELHGVPAETVHGILMGGYFSGLINRRVLDLTLDHEAARGLGSGLGCGALCLLGPGDCPVAVAASVMEYFARENAGQCGSCFNGTAAMAAVLVGLRDGGAGTDDIDRLRRWSTVLPRRGACGTLDGATNLAATLLDDFGGSVSGHLDGGCDRCATSPFRAARPFEVEAVTPA